MLVRGAEPMEKRQRRILFPLFLISTQSLYPAIREPVTPAAVSRQERSDRVSEEASYHPYLHIALTPHSHIFLLPH
ncbi:hypothetical protein DMW62_13225 [Serratia marcescens]|uniref:Secreted protein n=2 Tax=Gammaproteobacteria TaxID=1236 RepID=A0ABX5NCW7_SERMA|nr:hypothetical protein [Salmonella enterica]PYA30193.1 hypothetical protein DMW47_29085 [Serratia marcescens]PYA33327.1 hypothetical protein DMW44_27170 [Serratia marcescens]PYA37217.1 hypothetical protein DMW50_13125 [Serratia marcescens]PYA66701.1 hypothetical protein DMW51_13355 [Serratia marcescens]